MSGPDEQRYGVVNSDHVGCVNEANTVGALEGLDIYSASSRWCGMLGQITPRQIITEDGPYCCPRSHGWKDSQE